MASLLRMVVVVALAVLWFLGSAINIGTWIHSLLVLAAIIVAFNLMRAVLKPAPRRLEDVIDQVLDEIPSGGHPTLRSRLYHLKRELITTPQERMDLRWEEFTKIVEEGIGDPKDALWKKRVQRIVNRTRAAK